MPTSGSLIVHCLDVFGNYIGERVDIMLQNQDLASATRRVSNQVANGPLRVKGLRADTQNRYLVQVSANSYKMVSRFLSVKSGKPGETTFTMPVNPDKVLSVNFPPFSSFLPDLKSLLHRSDAVLGAEGKKGKALFDQLPDISKAGLLNICAKCNRTRLPSGRTILALIDRVLEVRGDRFFAEVPKILREEVKNNEITGAFRPASAILHRPPDGFESAGSWKTPDSVANLQLSFFSDGNNWRADIDIDDANGFAHFTQIVNNFFSGPTHPYNIHQLLISAQEIDPDYRFVIGE